MQMRMGRALRCNRKAERVLTDVLLGLTAALAIVTAPPVWAQKDTSSIVGTVRDSSGGVIPGAKVIATEVATGLSLTVVSDSAGDYVMTPLRVGIYRVEAQAEGMARQIFETVNLDVDQHLRVDFTLRPGSVQEQVTVVSVRP